MENINDPNGQQPNTNNNFDPKQFESLKEEITGIKDMLTEAMKEEEPQEPVIPQEPVRTQSEIEEDIWSRFDKNPPKSYKEIRDAFRDEMKAEEQAREKQRKDYESQIEVQRKNLNKKWDNEIATLERAGKLPKVIDPTDKEDAGLKARVELFTLASELGSGDLLKVYEKAYLPSVQTRGKFRSKPAGAAAPVGNSGSGSGGSAKPRTYREMKATDIEEVKKKYFPEDY